MDNLLEFLLKEIPSHAEDMISALNTSMEKINYARTLLRDKSSKLQNRDKLDEAIECIQANKELIKVENYLKEFLGDINVSLENRDSSLKSTDNATQTDKEVSSEQNQDWKEIEDDDYTSDDEAKDSKVDYRKYIVDNTIPYSLSKDLENTTPHSFSFMGNTYPVSTYLQVWLKLCEILYNRNKQTFENIAANHSISGKKKAYIVFKGDVIVKNNKKSIQFMDTDIILETNTSTIQKVSIMQKMLNIYKIPQSALKIYLENDRRPIHNQRPIGKYINQNYDYTMEINLQKTVNKTKPEIRIGKLAYDYFIEYFKDTNRQYNIVNFLDEEWCNENLGIPCPLLKQVDPERELKEQTIYGEKNYPSYAQNPKFLINGKQYIMCMRWYEVYRSKLEKWISEHEIIEIKQLEKKREKSNCIHYDFKKDLCFCENIHNPLFNQPCSCINSCKYYIEKEVYIVSKEEMKSKFCPNCGLKGENSKIEVTYTRNNIPALAVIKHLAILKCNWCNRNYINEKVFKSFTINKKLEDIDVNFIDITR